MKLLLLLMFSGSALLAQLPFGAGIKGGVPFTGLLKGGTSPTDIYKASNKHYTIGVMAEVRLPFRLAVEGDILYKRLGYTSTTPRVGATEQASTTGNAWEFPIVGKYKLRGMPTLHPYVGGGLSFRALQGLSQTVKTAVVTLPPRTTTTSTSSPPEERNSFTKGVVLEAGLEFHPILVHISPELRYTRWTSDAFKSTSGALTSGLNQMEFLVGITF